jgi:gliding motility-associated-like protein
MKFKITLLLLFCLFSAGAIAQNDCQDALVVCGNMGYEGLNATGFGVQELDNSNTCQSFESNSLWLKLPINTGGTLGFILTPGNPNIVVDFDFFIFGPDVTCGNIGQAIRCSTTNPEAAGSANNLTGMNDTATDTAEGPGEDGDNFVQWLTVQDGETYFLVIDRPIGGSDFSIQWTGTATFYDAPEYTNLQQVSLDLSQCDSDAVDDESTLFNLAVYENMLKGDQNFVTLTYHENSNDVLTGDNPIANKTAYANIENPQTIYMRMTNTVTGCFETETFELEITNPVVAGEPEDLALCDFNRNGLQVFHLSANDALIRQDNTTAAVTYYLTQADAENELNPLASPYINQMPYTTQTIWARLENTAGCYGHDITSFTLSILPIPDIVYTLDINDFTNQDNSITVEMPDIEAYEFSMDGHTFTDNPVFDGLLPGPYTIYIRAKTGCSTISEDLIILNYPKFFTPNGDGINETWKIPYLFLQPEAMINIFDRYGKVITGFNGSSPGWDGTLNNKKLPSTDYWFVLQLDNGRIIKGHFAMIR